MDNRLVEANSPMLDLVQSRLSSTSEAPLLTAFFLTIGSPQCIRHLRTACRSARRPQSARGLSAATLRDTMDGIRRLETTQRMNGILRRFFLVRLLEYQREIHATWDDSTALESSPPGIKRTTWVINQMMSAIDPTVVHPEQVDQGSRAYRGLRKQLQNQLTAARNYSALAETFGPAILALMVTDQDVPFTSSMYVAVSLVCRDLY